MVRLELWSVYRNFLAVVNRRKERRSVGDPAEDINRRGCPDFVSSAHRGLAEKDTKGVAVGPIAEISLSDDVSGVRSTRQREGDGEIDLVSPSTGARGNRKDREDLITRFILVYLGGDLKPPHANDDRSPFVHDLSGAPPLISSIVWSPFGPCQGYCRRGRTLGSVSDGRTHRRGPTIAGGDVNGMSSRISFIRPAPFTDAFLEITLDNRQAFWFNTVT